MYVCLCNELTSGKVREVVAAGARRMSEVYRASGCTAKCGICCRTVRQIVKEALDPHARPGVAAEARGRQPHAGALSLAIRGAG